MTSDLIARLEAAEVGSRELDGEICAALGEQPEWATKNHAPTQPQLWTDGKPGLHAREWLCPRYTTSLDTGLALAERVLSGWYVGVQANRYELMPTRDDWSAYLTRPKGARGSDIVADASTPSLALCAATLRAKLDG